MARTIEKSPYRRNDLRYPWTPELVAGLDQELDAIFKLLRALNLPNVTELDAGDLTTGTIPAAVLPAFAGDVTKPAGSVIQTLASSGATAGTYGDSTHVVQITVDAKGRVTAAANVAVLANPTYDAPLTNGDASIPEVIFDSFGDVVMVTGIPL